MSSIPASSRTLILDVLVLEPLRRLTNRNNLVLLVPVGLFLDCELLHGSNLLLSFSLMRRDVVHEGVRIRYGLSLPLWWFLVTRVLYLVCP